MSRTRVILLSLFLVLAAAFALQRTHPFSSGSDARAATENPARSGQDARSASGGAGGGGPIAVLTAIAKSEDVPIKEHSVGWVEPIASVAIRPRIDGVIVSQAVTDGQNVKAGDVLFKLDDKALQATLAKDRATLAKDQASAEQLQADLARLKKLQVGDYSTEQQVEQQQAALDEANASIAGDQAQIEADNVDIGYTTITAPIDGRIGVVNDTPGNLVHVSDTTPLMTITQMAPVRVSFTAPERDLDLFRQAIAGTPPATVSAIDADSGKALASGRLNFIDSSVDTGSGTVTVKADFDNADGALWPGEYVRVEAGLGVHRGATTVPLAAVQLNEKGSFVFLVKPDGTVAAQSVTVGEASGDSAVLASGLKPGDHVVVEGQLRLRDGARIAETLASAGTAAAGAGPASVVQ